MKSKLNSTAYVSVLFTFIFSFAACSQGPSNADEFSVSSVQAGENVTQPSSKESAATDSVFAPPPESPTPSTPDQNPPSPTASIQALQDVSELR
jgi:hypothetical protein